MSDQRAIATLLIPCRCALSVKWNSTLPRPYNIVRRMVDEAFAGIGATTPRVVAEIEVSEHSLRGPHRRPGSDHPARIDGKREIT